MAAVEARTTSCCSISVPWASWCHRSRAVSRPRRSSAAHATRRTARAAPLSAWAHDGYRAGDVPATMRNAHARTLVAVKIETAEGVRNAEQIMSVPGVDVAVIGHTDLSVSLGVPMQLDHPDFDAAIDAVLAACRDHGKAAGCVVGDPEQGRSWIARGFRSGDVLWRHLAVRQRAQNGDRPAARVTACRVENEPMQAVALLERSAVETDRTPMEVLPDRVPKPPGGAPGEPIIIKHPPGPPEVPEIDGTADEEDDPEIETPPDVAPEKSPPPAPWERADRPPDRGSATPRQAVRP